MTDKQAELDINTSQFTKEFSCDRCKTVLACSPDFDPPGCPNCNPELWEKLDG